VGTTVYVNDADTGLTYMQQRYYDPVAARFLSEDPVLTDANSGASFNRYVYAENNPYRYIDPDGRETISYGPNTEKLSSISEKIVTSAMTTAKVDSLTVTSTYRSPEDQARVMYQNTEKLGVDSQNKLYGKEGKEVIKAYSDAKGQKLGKSEVIKAMAEVVKSNPSAFKHSSDPAVLQAVDIDPGSVKGGDRKGFEDALKADKGVSNVFLPPKDPAIHVEIPQK